MKTLTRDQDKLWRTLQFLLRLLALSIPLYLVIFLALDLTSLQLSVAGATSWALTSLGWSVQQDGILLTANGFNFILSPDCTGWKSMVFLFALLFATIGVSLRKRLLGLLVGVPVIYLGNLARVLGTVFIQASYGTETALLVHDWLWQFGLIALVMAVWIIWLKSWEIGKSLGLLERKKKNKT